MGGDLLILYGLAVSSMLYLFTYSPITFGWRWLGERDGVRKSRRNESGAIYLKERMLRKSVEWLEHLLRWFDRRWEQWWVAEAQD